MRNLNSNLKFSNSRQDDHSVKMAPTHLVGGGQDLLDSAGPFLGAQDNVEKLSEKDSLAEGEGLVNSRNEPEADKFPVSGPAIGQAAGWSVSDMKTEHCRLCPGELTELDEPPVVHTNLGKEGSVKAQILRNAEDKRKDDIAISCLITNLIVKVLSQNPVLFIYSQSVTAASAPLNG